MTSAMSAWWETKSQRRLVVVPREAAQALRFRPVAKHPGFREAIRYRYRNPSARVSCLKIAQGFEKTM